MKKFISVMLCVCICLSSTVFCFADFTSTDSTTLSNIYKNMPTASQITTLNSTLSTISSRVLNIYNALFNGNHSVAYWVSAIDSFMSPILTAIQNTPTELESIKRLLGYVSYEGDTEVIDPYLAYQTKGVAQWISDIYTVDNVTGAEAFNNRVNTLFTNDTGKHTVSVNFNRNWRNSIYQMLQYLNDNLVNSYYYNYQHRDSGYNSAQSFKTWDTLTSSSFTPTSAINGIYTWFSKVQEPVARLSYVLASDERIDAQEKAADNEQAVVDNFIDSSGSGSASPSNIGSVSDLSSGFKNNISTDASVSDIWNIFNADNFGWFSQETADQLDNSGSSTRTLRNSGSYPTPLLDQQIEDILKYIGGDNND